MLQDLDVRFDLDRWHIQSVPMMKGILFLLIIFAFNSLTIQPIRAGMYTWLAEGDSARCIEDAISTPPGYRRTAEISDSFGAWLRRLPLRDREAPVLLHDGSPKSRQDVHEAVVAMDTGIRDLQQCADAVIRLRAEYLYAMKRAMEIRFRFTSGHEASYESWTKGHRPSIDGNDVTWEECGSMDTTYDGFRDYLNTVFMYAGSYSLRRDMPAREHLYDIEIGDVFIQGGFPGHVVIVLDMVEKIQTREKLILLAQSYMPAQELHILKNFKNKELSPWYELPIDGLLITPEWTFHDVSVRFFGGLMDG